MPSDEEVSVTSPLTHVKVELEGCKQAYRAMLDTCATVLAVAKASLIPSQSRESLGKPAYKVHSVNVWMWNFLLCMSDCSRSNLVLKHRIYP